MRATMPIDRNAQVPDDAGLSELKLAAVAALIGLAAAVIFVGWPDLDLAVARLFYVEPRHFLFNQSTLASILRFGFRLVTWTTAALAVIGIILVLARGAISSRSACRNGYFSRSCSSPGPGSSPTRS